MSIAPVQIYPLVNSEQSPHVSVRATFQAGSGSGAAEAPAKSVSGTSPKEEKVIAKTISSTYELPQDVVEVHQDPEIKNQIIIQYLDQAKNVVLQVPSELELSVERGIASDLQRAAKLAESAGTSAATGQGGKGHGNKL
jgi:hypothetical protein